MGRSETICSFLPFLLFYCISLSWKSRIKKHQIHKVKILHSSVLGHLRFLDKLFHVKLKLTYPSQHPKWLYPNPFFRSDGFQVKQQISKVIFYLKYKGEHEMFAFYYHFINIVFEIQFPWWIGSRFAWLPNLRMLKSLDCPPNPWVSPWILPNKNHKHRTTWLMAGWICTCGAHRYGGSTMSCSGSLQYSYIGFFAWTVLLNILGTD